MKKCDVCSEEVKMPYKCNYCDSYHCSKHRIPEKHNCPKLKTGSIQRPNTKQEQSSSRTLSSSNIPIPNLLLNTSATALLLGAIFLTYILQIIIVETFGADTAELLFVLSYDNYWHVWTWVTSIFAHGGFLHLIINIMVLFFFGTVVEQQLGKKKFILFFITAGMIAGIAQVTVMFLFVPETTTAGVVGASGAITALLGYLTILKPRLPVYLFFFIPMPIVVLTVAFSLYSIGIIVLFGFGAGQVAHIAHLAGVIIGLIYGYRHWGKVSLPNQYSPGLRK